MAHNVLSALATQLSALGDRQKARTGIGLIFWALGFNTGFGFGAVASLLRLQACRGS